MNHTSSVDTLLMEWGAVQRTLPVRHTALRQAALTRLTPHSENTTSRVSGPRMIWLLVGLVGAAVVSVIVLNPQAQTLNSLSLNQEKSYSSGALFDVGSNSASIPSAMRPSGGTVLPHLEDVAVTDSREFLKTDYTATARTRHVVRNAQRLETIVRGFGGRVDTSSIQDTEAHITFVLPVAKLEAFRGEARLLLGTKFVGEHMYTENLLSDKRSIEENTRLADDRLAALQGERNTLVTVHERSVSTLQAQIKANSKEQTVLKTEMQNHPDEALLFGQRIIELDKSGNSLQARLSAENVNFSAALSTLDSQIKNTQSTKDALQKQDNTLLATVATVAGSISLAHIGVWGWLTTYVPLKWLILTLLMVLVGVVYTLAMRKPIAL